ncbi:unnamed protein product [Allacma fusca]|uniref:Insulin-like domain-containing protein n=1 Tax=Allacma fusca TaxID=39272 RepID=A0A8J2PKR4_9HEXA|nr:unnamed protein product [Allacma fusca]
MMTWKNELVLVMGKFCAVLISIWITSTSNADGKALVEETTTPHNTDRVRACGVRLRHEIASICNLSSLRNNGYYIPGPPSIIEPRRNVPEEGSSTRQLSANNEIPTRTSRGVIEECCRKPCDRLQLLKYCASSEMKDKSTILETTTPPSDSLSGLIPSSDETISDTIGSVQSDSEESYQRPLIKNLASQVTDEPQPDFFPIPAGTNAEFFIL